MANRVRRWRGPRRPDVQELKDYSFAGQTSAGNEDGAAAAAPLPTHLRANPGVRHFKYNFLSAGLQTAEQSQAAALRVNVRPSIMDAMRTFEPPSAANAQGRSKAPASTETLAEKQARALSQSAQYRYPAGLGYGTQHAQHFQYLSKAQPPRAPESFDERPCAFPTVDLPPAPVKPGHGDLNSLPYEEQDAYSATLKSRIASGIGYGYMAAGTSAGSHQHAYVANTYWRRQ